MQCGTISELTALRYYAEQGYSLFLPYNHDTPVDFIALKGTEMIRVQVKSATVYRHPRGSTYLGVQLTGYTIEDFDELFVVEVTSPRRWRIPWRDLKLAASFLTLDKLDADGKPCPYQRLSKKRPDTNQWRVDALDRTVHRELLGPGSAASSGSGDHPG